MGRAPARRASSTGCRPYKTSMLKVYLCRAMVAPAYQWCAALLDVVSSGLSRKEIPILTPYGFSAP